MAGPSKPDTPQEIERISLRVYAAMNVVFWLICAAQYLIVRLWLGAAEGISFFFAALAVGFTLVCVFDFLCGLAGIPSPRGDAGVSASNLSARPRDPGSADS